VSDAKVPLLLPVEGQVRELDAKILLASIAARRGFPVVIGRRLSIDRGITAYPRSVYLCKDIDPHSIEMFRILEGLGHEIVAWDEEALVHFPPEIHFARRMSPIAIRHASQLFAWGPDNEALWRRYPELPDELPIHVTGNARFDLLRPGLRGYFDSEARALREAHGDFVLINTNFPLVNAKSGIFLPPERPGEERPIGRGGYGMPRAFAEQMERHKRAVLEAFERMIPELERSFPKVSIVIRPHPSEFPKVYHRIAAKCERVKVVHEGNVVPWLMAAKAVIHNGCTTGVESNLLDVPTLAYGPTNGDDCDFGESFRLPSLLSHRCPDFETLHETMKGILDGTLGCFEGEERKRLLAHYLAPQQGRLASERIVDLLEAAYRGRAELPAPALADRLRALQRATVRRVQRSDTKKKLVKTLARKQAREPELKRRGFETLHLDDMQERVRRFSQLLDLPDDLRVERLEKNVFRISA
jgi:surface carbohydrate biosynthesis protein